MDAIHYEPEVSETVSLKNFKKESRRLNPEEKRLRYAMTCSQDLREEWTSERSG
jgi:hypothetical protein